MTDTAQDLRSALERIRDGKTDLNDRSDYARGWNDARFRMRQIADSALAAPATDEPVAWLYVRKDGKDRQVFTCQWRALSGPDWTETPLYAHPPAAPHSQNKIKDKPDHYSLTPFAQL